MSSSAEATDLESSNSIVKDIRDHQNTLADNAYNRYRTFIHSFLTKESAIYYTKKAIMHLDAGKDYQMKALNRVTEELEKVEKFTVSLQRVPIGPHDLMRLTLTVE